METLRTGDLLLFSELPSDCCMSCLDCLIKRCTRSKYSHSALVVVDPPWAPTLKGIYVWESSWHGEPDPQDGITKFGVQLTPLTFYTTRYPGRVSIWVRHQEEKTAFGREALINIHPKVYKKAYDTRPRDWFLAALCRRTARQVDSFTCSAFVSYILTELDILDTNTCWTTISAAELSSSRSSNLVRFKKPNYYCNDIFFGHFPKPDSALIANDGIDI
jgi:hypothetical protein